MAKKRNDQTIISEAIGSSEESSVLDIESYILYSGSDHVPTFGGAFEGGIQVQQVPDEFAACIKAILDTGEPINNYLEIGSAAGGSAFLMHHFFHPANIILVDDNKHPKAHIRPYILRDVPHRDIIGNSHDQGTINKVIATGLIFDVIMIDGDHFYDGASFDVQHYSQVLRSGGFLIFHDSRIGTPYGCYGVARDIEQSPEWSVVNEYLSSKYPVCGILLARKVVTE